LSAGNGYVSRCDDELMDENGLLRRLRLGTNRQAGVPRMKDNIVNIF